MPRIFVQALVAYLSSLSVVDGLDSSWSVDSSTPDSYTCTKNNNEMISNFKKNLLTDWATDANPPDDAGYLCDGPVPATPTNQDRKPIISNDGKHRMPGILTLYAEHPLFTGCWKLMQVSTPAVAALSFEAQSRLTINSTRAAMASGTHASDCRSTHSRHDSR